MGGQSGPGIADAPPARLRLLVKFPKWNQKVKTKKKCFFALGVPHYMWEWFRISRFT